MHVFETFKFIQFSPALVLRYRSEKPRQVKLPLMQEEENALVSNCKTVYNKRFHAFQEQFSRVCIVLFLIGDYVQALFVV